MKNSRRQFMLLSAAGACTLALNGKVQAQAMVSESEHQAADLGYKTDAPISRQSWVICWWLLIVCR